VLDVKKGGFDVGVGRGVCMGGDSAYTALGMDAHFGRGQQPHSLPARASGRAI